MAKGLILNKEVKKNYIALVLDKSGSMGSIKDSIIEAFNDNIETLKKETEGMITKVCLVVFSTHGNQSVPLWMADLDSVKPLTEKNYQPGGMTAMYDAVGYTLKRLSEDTKNETGDISYLVTVVSDGHENDSKNYKGSDIAEMIQARNEDGRWTITYVGANQDLSKVAKDMKLSSANTLNFDASKEGVRAMSVSYSTGTQNYFNARRKGLSSVDNFYEGVSVEAEDSE